MIPDHLTTLQNRLEKLVHGEPAQELTHFFLCGFVGLLIEWFVIGLSPWSNPDAHPVMMLIFQLGMFSLGTTVAFAPRLIANTHDVSWQSRNAILKFNVSDFVSVYLVSFTVPEQAKFVTIIALILFGSLFLNVFYVNYFVRSFSRIARATNT